jgi:hypothetical protein
MEGGGRFGAVGDGGTSYGPFQLHVGGALPPGKNAAWANSPAGVLYAMQHMATVAAGLRGARAISQIVRRFERPAQPAPEIQGAIARYGSIHGGGRLTPMPSGVGAGGAHGGGLAAALAMLSQLHNPTVTPPVGQLKTPADILNSVIGSAQVPDAFQPVQALPQMPAVGASGQSAGSAMVSLDATRRRLLGSF